jgi:crossover junction endodeoxyribonuclease RuvC
MDVFKTTPPIGAPTNIPPDLETIDFGSSTVLTIDLGITTGWAYKQANGQITSGTIEFKSGRYEGGGMIYLRCLAWLDEVHQCAGPIGRIYFEEVRRHLGTTAAHIYGGFLSHVSSWAEKRQIPYQGVPVGTIKKHATGKGNASKEAVIKAMKQRGHNPSDHNEADALAILHWALEKEVR